VAQDQGDFDMAEEWYTKAVTLRMRIGDEGALATTFHQLARIGQLTGDLPAAVRWCQRALEIKERLHDDESAAPTYQLLGVLADAGGDLTNAERWCRKALEIQERQGNHSGAAYSYNLLGAVAAKKGDYVSAGTYFIRCNVSFNEAHDFEKATTMLNNFAICYRDAPAKNRATLREMWEAGGYDALFELPE